MCGKAGRLGQVVPDAKPFVSNLYGALAGSLQAQANRSREAPPDHVATRRYRSAAQWLACLLRQEANAPLKLESKVWAGTFDYDPQKLRIEFDASPFGAWGNLVWRGVQQNISPSSGNIEWLGILTGLSKHQTFWEFLTLALAAVRWCPLFPAVLICGDNLASLNLAISGKSKGLLGNIGRELAWRQAKYDWHIAVAHLPAESNKLADRLSRLTDPSLPPLVDCPSELIGSAEVRVSVDALWSLHHH